MLESIKDHSITVIYFILWRNQMSINELLEIYDSIEIESKFTVYLIDGKWQRLDTTRYTIVG